MFFFIFLLVQSLFTHWVLWVFLYAYRRFQLIPINPDSVGFHGKLEIHKSLKVVNEQPGIRVFRTCKNLIRTLSSLPTDDKNPEDVDTNAEDHAYDALRYGCMSRPTHPKYAARFRTAFSQNNDYITDSKFGY